MKVRHAAAAAMLLVAVFGVPDVQRLSVPVVRPKDQPSVEMKNTVKPVVKVVSRMSPIDRVWLNSIYANAAKIVTTDGLVDPPVIVTTEGLRAIHVAILKFIWRGMADNKPGEYEGLSEAIDAAVSEVLGDTSRPLTPELRKRAAEVFEAIAWAGTGEG